MALSYTTLLQHEEYDVHNTSTRPAACVRLLLCCSKCTAFSS
jgi:hypothetical protein